MFSLTEQPIEPLQCIAALKDKRAGAMVSFEGWIRNHNDGRPVAALTYEVFGPMAVAEGNKLIEEAKRRFAIIDAQVIHRTGETVIGDRAVWVGVTAEHRQEAFLAARWIMDAIKRSVPIWKKENYTDGAEGEWIHASGHEIEVHEDAAENPLYSRQVILPQFGRQGQRKLADSSIVVIGAGGLGCPALQYLAAAGIGSIKIVDGDVVEVSNLHRQVLFGVSDIGRNKAEAAAGRLRDMNPSISIRAIADAAYPDTIADIIKGTDLVLDCTDGFESKYFIHDACWQSGVPVVQASVHQYDGWIQIVDPRADAGCYRCQWPEAPEPGCIGTCAEAGVLGVTPGTLGTMQATQSIAWLIGHEDRLVDATLYVDVISGQTSKIKRIPRQDCPCRSGGGWPRTADNLLLPGKRARELMDSATIVDIRESRERVNDPEWIRNLISKPRDQWKDIPESVPSRPLVLCCSMGIRTRSCVQLLGNPPGIYAWAKPIHDLPIRKNPD